MSQDYIENLIIMGVEQNILTDISSNDIIKEMSMNSNVFKEMLMF